jgi:transcriptional regulator NrdR family protein
VASEKELHHSTKRKPVLNKEISASVIKIRLELTRQNLQEIYAEGIGVNLPNGVYNVPRLVEAFEPGASREQICPL